MNQPDELPPKPPNAQEGVEIAHHQWTPYLDSFSREHLDWLVTLEVRSREGRLMIAEERPLKGVSLDTAEGVDRAYIQVGGGPDAHLTHIVEQPVRVTFKRSQSGRHEGLEIASANGTITVVRFRSAMKPESVDGIAASKKYASVFRLHHSLWRVTNVGGSSTRPRCGPGWKDAAGTNCARAMRPPPVCPAPRKGVLRRPRYPVASRRKADRVPSG